MEKRPPAWVLLVLLAVMLVLGFGTATALSARAEDGGTTSTATAPDTTTASTDTGGTTTGTGTTTNPDTTPTTSSTAPATTATTTSGTAPVTTDTTPVTTDSTTTSSTVPTTTQADTGTTGTPALPAGTTASVTSTSQQPGGNATATATGHDNNVAAQGAQVLQNATAVSMAVTYIMPGACPSASQPCTITIYNTAVSNASNSSFLLQQICQQVQGDCQAKIIGMLVKNITYQTGDSSGGTAEGAPGRDGIGVGAMMDSPAECPAGGVSLYAVNPSGNFYLVNGTKFRFGFICNGVNGKDANICRNWPADSKHDNPQEIMQLTGKVIILAMNQRGQTVCVTPDWLKKYGPQAGYHKVVLKPASKHKNGKK